MTVCGACARADLVPSPPGKAAPDRFPGWSEVAVEEGRELALGHGTHLGAHQRAVLEQHQRRNAADAVFGRNGLLLVDVDLGHRHAVGIVVRHLVQNGGDELARTAPFGPEIYQHGNIRLQNVGVEAVGGNVFDTHRSRGTPVWVLKITRLARKGHPPVCSRAPLHPLRFALAPASYTIGPGRASSHCGPGTWSGPEGSSYK